MSDLDREEEVVDGPNAWSVTLLQTVHTCGYKYKLRYIDKIPEPKTPALKFGTAVHLCIDRMHKESIWEPGDVQEMWADTWTPVSIAIDWALETDKISKTTYKNRGVKMLETYAKGHRDDVVVNSEIKFVTSSKPGSGTENFPKLRGIIDKVQEIAPGVLAIVDFKTSKYPPDWTVLRRDFQLTTYWIAARELGYNVNHLAIHHLLSGEVYWTTRDESDEWLLADSMDEAFYKLREEKFARNIDFHCKWCPFKEQCLSVGGSTS